MTVIESTEISAPVNSKGTLARATRWALQAALDIDRESARADVRDARAKYPDKTNKALARMVVSRARWKGVAVGVVSGLPSNPLAALGAAALDVASVLRINVEMAVRIALIYDETYLDDSEPPYELLIPIIGGTLVGELAQKAALAAGKTLTKAAIEKYVSRGVLKTVKKASLKYLGVKITQKALITKAIPLVSGAIGGSWNFGEVHLVGGRVIHYFENRQ